MGQFRANRITFIGRVDEVESLVEELGEHRLVTLIGVGGTGKTRLSVEAARSVSESFSGGGWMVRRQGRVLVTLDLDFANPFVFDPRPTAGIIVLRLPKMHGPSDVAAVVDQVVIVASDRDVEGAQWIVSVRVCAALFRPAPESLLDRPPAMNRPGFRIRNTHCAPSGCPRRWESRKWFSVGARTLTRIG